MIFKWRYFDPYHLHIVCDCGQDFSICMALQGSKEEDAKCPSCEQVYHIYRDNKGFSVEPIKDSKL